MNIFNQTLTHLFDYLFKPFGYFSPSLGLCFISSATGILLLKLFGLFSNQKTIKQAKNQIRAHLLGVVLYKEDIRISLREQARLLKANLLYMKCTLLPLVILVAVCIPILAQLNLRYGYRPLAVGDKATITVTPMKQNFLNDISIRSDGGLKIMTPPVRIKEHNEVDWKLEAIREGKENIEISLNGSSMTMEINIGAGIDKLTPVRSKKLLYSLLYPGERRLNRESDVESIRISYAPGHVLMFGHPFHWFLIFCVVSILSGLLFKRILKVEI